MKVSLSLMLITIGLLARADEKTDPGVAFVPADKTCVFRRGEDLNNKALLEGLNSTISKLAEQCKPLQADILSLHQAMEQIANHTGIADFNDAKHGAGAGFQGRSLNCANYPWLLEMERDAAQKWATSPPNQRGDAPSERHAKECAQQDPSKMPCWDRIYFDKMRLKRHSCAIDNQVADFDDYQKRVQDSVSRVSALTGKILSGIDVKTCNGDINEVVDSALNLVGSLGALNPSLGMYSVGIAVGADVMRGLFNRLQKKLSGGGKDAVLKMETLDRLACTYSSVFPQAMLCNQNPTRNSVPRRQIPHESREYFSQVMKLNKLVSSLRESALANQGRIEPKQFDDLSTFLMTADGALRVPYDLAGGQVGFTKRVTMLDYLNWAQDALAKYRPANSLTVDRDGIPVGRINDEVGGQVRKQGAQLKEIVEAFVEYRKKIDDPASKARLLKALQVPPPKEGPAIDIVETLMHTWEPLRGDYGLEELAIDGLLTRKRAPELPATQRQLNAGFTVLIGELKKLRGDYFNTAAMDNIQRDENREAAFNNKIEPLLRACALLPGLFFLDEKLIDGRDATDHLKSENFWQKMKRNVMFDKSDVDKYQAACARFQCDQRFGLPHYHVMASLAPSRQQEMFEFFRQATCGNFKHFEPIRKFYKANFLASGSVCPPPGTLPADHPWQQGNH